MIPILRKIKILGICGSPRSNGNSQYLLDCGLQASEQKYGELIEVQQSSFKGKKILPCLSCFRCSEGDSVGECVIHDDFQNLRDLWVEADVIIYSMPVYHYGIPGQVKCFLDRLGNTLNRRFETTSPRLLKILGAIVQGSHFAAGQESAVTFLAQHAILKNCIPVSGDGWQSYLGACGWTLNSREKSALKDLVQNGNQDAQLAVAASRSLCTRAIELALIVHFGAKELRLFLSEEPVYKPYLDRLEQGTMAAIKEKVI
jgi:multimeric flavodoxin WrbA